MSLRNSSFVKPLLDRWELVAPERKRVLVVAGLLVAIFGASAVMKRDRVQLPKAGAADSAAKLDVSVVTPTRREEGIPELRAQVDTLKNQLLQNKTETQAVKGDVAVIKDTGREQENTQVAELNREIAAMREEMRAYKSTVLNGPSPDKNLPIPALPPPPQGAGETKTDPQKPAVKPLAITISGANTADESPSSLTLSASPTAAKKEGGGHAEQPKTPAAAKPASVDAQKHDTVAVIERDAQYIPAGTIIRGVLLNGLDAPTSGMAMKQPVPALMRIKSLAFLPNRFTQDIRECFVILAGHGNLSSERAKMRTETISCVRSDGGVVETSLDGFAVGEDGKEGIKGALVTKQGSLIARSLVAGFISGFANVTKPSAVAAISTNPGSTSTFQTPDLGTAMQASALSGVSTAANDIAKFFLETAKEMHPVVEIPAETEVTVVLVRGTSLALGNTKNFKSRLMP